MTTAVQHRRGTTAEHSTFTGLEGEVTIDTTKDTAVIHDGALAGGYPLAKETLSNANPATLGALDGASSASDDLFLVYDTSASQMKKMTRAELNNAVMLDPLDTVDINGGTIDGTAIGSASASTGAFTTLTSSSTTTLNGTTIPASVTLVSTAATQTLTNKTLTTPTISSPTVSDGTANGVAYLNGSKVLTTGSALTFDGTNLGVAMSNPASFLGKFGVNGNIALGAGGIQYFWSPTNTYGWSIRNAVNDLTFANYGGSDQMTLTSTGLGIGTSSPNTKLTVSTSGADGINITADTGTTTQSGRLFFSTGTAGQAYVLMNIAGALAFNSGATANASSGTERARIDSSGNWIQTVNTTAATLTTNQTLTFSIVDNSTLRISVRGSDGTTRTATIALS